MHGAGCVRSGGHDSQPRSEQGEAGPQDHGSAVDERAPPDTFSHQDC